jgi:hypothetical protein
MAAEATEGKLRQTNNPANSTLPEIDRFFIGTSWLNSSSPFNPQSFEHGITFLSNGCGTSSFTIGPQSEKAQTSGSVRKAEKKGRGLQEFQVGCLLNIEASERGATGSS